MITQLAVYTAYIPGALPSPEPEYFIDSMCDAFYHDEFESPILGYKFV